MTEQKPDLKQCFQRSQQRLQSFSEVPEQFFYNFVENLPESGWLLCVQYQTRARSDPSVIAEYLTQFLFL